MDSKIKSPLHIGYIVDGNRRWAKKFGIPAYEGHLAGYNTLKDVAVHTFNKGVKYVSAYVFSTENWKRDSSEVEKLLALVLRLIKSDLKLFHKEKISIRVLGSREGLSSKIIQAIEKAESETSSYEDKVLGLCFNYGGQLEIIDAVKNIAKNGKDDFNNITPELIAENLYHSDIPNCDVIVRTSGEKRLSNFMLWRSAYSELFFLDKFWPDMSESDVDEIIDEFSGRNRRFGGN